MPEWLQDVIKLLVIVAALYFSLTLYVHRWLPTRASALGRRRVTILWVLGLAVVLVKIAEDAIGGDSGPTDRAILTLIHDLIPEHLVPLFQAITLVGSAKVLFPVAAVITLAWTLLKHRLEALVLAVSTIGAELVVYLVKTLVGRERPSLWDTEDYWGSSFPSGHTLVSTAVATAIALGIGRMRPAAYRSALAVATLFSFLVGMSRMVLGVHWPTDVAASWCVGTLLPLITVAALRWRQPATTDANSHTGRHDS